MGLIIKWTDLHTAPTTRAKIVIHIHGILNDDGPITIGTAFDGFNPCMRHGCHQRMARNLKIEGPELEVQIIGPFGKVFHTARQFQKVNSLGNPDERQAGL